MIEAADYAGARGDVGEEEAPGCGGAERRRKDHGGIGVERAGRRGETREFSDADGNEENGDGCENIGEPGTVASEGADERNCSGGGGGRRNRGDGLREGFHWGEHFAP